MNRVLAVNLTTDQGESIKPGFINFSKFNTNPVLLIQHKWDEVPIGKVENVKISSKGVRFKPIFNDITEGAKMMKALYKQGFLTAQPGGYIKRDDDGNIIEFILYEISLCI